MRLYVIYDKVAEEAGPPFIAKNDGVAQRMHQNTLIRDKVDPSDYDLMFIGTYDKEIPAVLSADPVVVMVSMSTEEGNEGI